MKKSVLFVLLIASLTTTTTGCGAADAPEEELDDTQSALGSARHKVIADIDRGGGVLLANRPGGFYMGRLFPGYTFDREGGWYKGENGSSYAFGMAWGNSNSCFWIGPSRGKKGFTAGQWATAAQPAKGTRCDKGEKDFLQAGDAKNIGSHFNCPPPSKSAHGTEKKLTKDAPLYWNLDWRGGYRGGPMKNGAGIVPKGSSVWYRYTTNDQQHIVVFVPGIGWGFMPIGVLNREHTGTWSDPNDGKLQRC